MKIFDELVGRGLIKQTTNAEKIRQMLDESSCNFYLGIDPTADSLHVGHLIPLITAMRLKSAGHNPAILLGDATAKIGDPSGKSSARPMMDEDQIDCNVVAIEEQIRRIFSDKNVFFFRNDTWTRKLNMMDFMRDVGVHFSINNMLRSECFKSRMETGLTFLEFSYMLLQAHDFFWLNNQFRVSLQIGGDDQWSNMLAGTDLIRKKLGRDSFAFTTPLLVNSDGTKMGKTEKGTVWLDKEKTSISDFFQFWRNIPDANVGNCFKFLTFLSLEEIETLAIHPFQKDVMTIQELNNSKKKLAFEITKIVHGEKAAQATLEVAEALFESQDASRLEAIPIKDGDHILDLLVRCQLAKSRTDGRNLIMGRGITLNDEVLSDPTMILTQSQLGDSLVLRKGKKHFRRLLFTKDANEQT